METIPLLIIIIALLGFLILMMANCAEDDETKNKRTSRSKVGNRNAKGSIKNRATSAKISIKNELPTSKVTVTMSKAAAAAEAKASSSIQNSTDVTKDTRPKLPINSDMGPILVDQATYDVLKQKYNLSPPREPASKSVLPSLSHSGKSNVMSYKTQSFTGSSAQDIKSKH